MTSSLVHNNYSQTCTTESFDLKSASLQIIMSVILIAGLWLSGVGDLKGQSITGMTGLFHIPTAEMMPDKTVMFGYTHLPMEVSTYSPDRYDNRLAYATVTFLPRLEVMFRYSYDLGAPRGTDISLFMDRMVAGRVLILKESKYLPALLFGMNDPGFDVSVITNNYFGVNYFVASKNINPFGFNLGLHSGMAFNLFEEEIQTMNGLFGGISVSHSKTPWADLIVEYDSRRINTALKLLLFNHLQVMAGLMDMQYPAGGVGVQVQL